jgi:polyisoprenoid-binding protein YceI
MKKIRYGAVLLPLLLAPPARAAGRAIDVEHSSLTIHVGKSGVLSAFGDDHTIKAPIAAGSVNEAPEPHVEVTVDGRKLTVLDPDLSADKRSEVQKRTLGPEVLDVERYPEIRFRSTKIAKLPTGRWRVEGLLEMHGKSSPVSFDVTAGGDRVRGTATISQRAFGIEPIKVAGGTVRVKDEVRVELDVTVAGSESSPAR